MCVCMTPASINRMSGHYRFPHRASSGRTEPTAHSALLDRHEPLVVLGVVEGQVVVGPPHQHHASVSVRTRVFQALLESVLHRYLQEQGGRRDPTARVHLREAAAWEQTRSWEVDVHAGACSEYICARDTSVTVRLTGVA